MLFGESICGEYIKLYLESLQHEKKNVAVSDGAAPVFLEQALHEADNR